MAIQLVKIGDDKHSFMNQLILIYTWKIEMRTLGLSQFRALIATHAKSFKKEAKMSRQDSCVLAIMVIGKLLRRMVSEERARKWF